MKKLLFFFLLQPSILFSKILIITHSYNRPDFIEIQHRTFKKFLQDDYEFVVFNDARNTDPKTRDAIKNTCKNLELRCIRIPQDLHTDPYLERWPGEPLDCVNVRCANVVQFSLDILGFKHNDIVMIIDSDAFLIKPFHIRNYMKQYDFASIPQCKDGYRYFWNALVIMNMKTLPHKETLNFNCGQIDGVSIDVGAHLYYYFKNNKNVRIGTINGPNSSGINGLQDRSKEELLQKGYTEESISLMHDDKINNVNFFLNGTFLHYRAASNWNHQSNTYIDHKTKLLNKFIDKITL